VFSGIVNPIAKAYSMQTKRPCYQVSEILKESWQRILSRLKPSALNFKSWNMQAKLPRCHQRRQKRQQSPGLFYIPWCIIMGKTE